MANRAPKRDEHIFTIADLRLAANKRLPKMYREYFDEGAMDLITVRDNEEAYNRLKIRPRILRDVTSVDPSTTIFGQKVAFPLGFSPTGNHKLAHPQGEIATSNAAAKFGIGMALSTYSTVALEDVIAQGQGNPYVMQCSLVKDEQTNLQLIQRAEAAGYKALFVTVDAPTLGRRLNEIRNQFELPAGTEYPNFSAEHRSSTIQDTASDSDALHYGKRFASLMKWIRAHTKLEVWLKGIYTAEDVEEAIANGVDGILVSNHGGRQADGVAATIDALPECVAAARGRVPVHIDGGIRRGSDIFKALALGAQHCWVGRVAIWGLAHNGEAGATLALQLLYDEFKTIMTLAGCATVADIKPSHLGRIGTDGVLSKL
ncbi:hypothetical protein JCM10207_008083 [Rhodosporidiobolus poonsookiae]